jgi:hypothetical protein
VHFFIRDYSERTRLSTMSRAPKKSAGRRLSNAVELGDEELQSLVREAQGRGTKHGVVKTTIIKRSGNSTVWKVLTLVLIGTVFLLAWDSVEIKQSTTGNNRNDDNPTTFGGEVQLKNPPSNKEGISTTQNGISTPDTSSTADDASKGTDDATSPANNPASTGSSPATTDTAPNPTNMSNIDAGSRSTTRHTYRRRGQPMPDEDRQAMVDKWGYWTLIDDKERPQHDYYQAYPHRDIPRSEFPPNAWQVDKDYIAKFLPESIALVQRAQDAILAEYGKTEGSWEDRSKMFQVELIEDLATAKGLSNSNRNHDKRESLKQGGWSTPSSWEGLTRRMLHAVMTEDNFVFAMGGHSAAAGHG